MHWRHGYAAIEAFVYEPPSKQDRDNDAAADQAQERMAAISKADRFVILAMRRGQRTFPTTLGFVPRKGDVAAVAIYTLEHDDARASLAELGWRPVSAEVAEAPPSQERAPASPSPPVG